MTDYTKNFVSSKNVYENEELEKQIIEDFEITTDGYSPVIYVGTLNEDKKTPRLDFLYNSSIWVRFCERGFEDKIERCKKEIECFKELGLYEFVSAKEHLEFNIRIIRQNRLADIDTTSEDGVHGKHSKYVVPITYGDEVKDRDAFLLNNGSAMFNGEFKFLGEKIQNSNDFKTNKVNLRILLVDDKIPIYLSGKCEEQKDIPNTNCLLKCDCKKCREKKCKLRTIQKLLSGDFLCPDSGNGFDEESKNQFIRNSYWNNTIGCYCLNKKIEIKEIHESGSELKGKFDSSLDTIICDSGSECVIVGVSDIETALVLLNYYKFDMLFLDYILGDYNEDCKEYSTEFFGFLQCNCDNDGKKDELKILNNLRRELKSKLNLPKDSCNTVLKKLQTNVKDNRGPLDRFWIMPITAFNQPFISDLLNHNVRLIDHLWNISHGADPINTPWQFLYALNHFIDLQLRGSVFASKQLLTFLQYTGEELEEHIIKKDKDAVDFNEFQFFMGSEYASFMRHYGNMRLIQYDADTTKRSGEKNKVLSNKSLFSTYVWENFYNNDEFVPLLGLNRKMRNFYYTAAFMPNDHNGRKRLREAFNDLRLTIDLENLVQEDEKKDFEEAINNISKALNTLD